MAKGFDCSGGGGGLYFMENFGMEDGWKRVRVRDCGREGGGVVGAWRGKVGSDGVGLGCLR